jgi:hypothetical protein
MRDGLPLVAKDMHLLFECLVVTGAPSIHASLMDFHHNTLFKYILDDDSISSTSKTYICFCSTKGARLWLVVRPFIDSFRITHFIFTLVLHFRLNLILPSTSTLFTCECGHMLDACNTHLVHYPFGGQWIPTHDTIRDVMYALA